MRWRASECLLGALLASLIQLSLESFFTDGFMSERMGVGLQIAEELFTLVLRSPISVNEIMQSGWHLGAVLLFVRQFPQVERVAGPWLHDPSVGSERRLLSLLEELPGDPSLRIPQDLTFATMMSPKSISTQVASCVASWSAAVNFQREAWRAETLQNDAIQVEVSTLLALGETQLKRELLKGRPVAPLKRLLAVPPFVLHLLQALHLQPVVHADALAAFLELPRSLRQKALPRSWQRARGKAPLLELRPLPADDSLSNAVRAKRGPVCGDWAFLAVISMLAKEALAKKRAGAVHPLSWWEAGANQGDCSTTAVHMLSSWGRQSRQAESLFKIHATLFEPILDSAAATRGSAAALLRRLRQNGDRSKLAVRQLALGAKVGELDMNLKRRASAQASFRECQGFPGFCEVQTVSMETIDNLLQKEAEVVDMLRIHVQGFELDVLAGAQHALSEGLFCVVHLLTCSIHREEFLSKDAMDAALTSLDQMLSNYTAMAVKFKLGEDAEILSLKQAHARIIHKKTLAPKDPYENFNVVAWHHGPRCSGRMSVHAAERIFGA